MTYIYEHNPMYLTEIFRFVLTQEDLLSIPHTTLGKLKEANGDIVKTLEVLREIADWLSKHKPVGEQT